ncbi:hypothetical protein, partial [Nocardia farcinica]|uniref:hypothetical protein n=1 Tax=Nocardia farcinica TaxID=37329 RepID=UPI0018946E5B
MPKRTNAFQKLVATITAHLSAGAIVTESKMLIDLDTGQEREVDICIEQDVAGHPLRICIECSSQSNDQNLWIPGGRAFPEDDRRSHRILIKTSVGALAGRHARAHG